MGAPSGPNDELPHGLVLFLDPRQQRCLDLTEVDPGRRFDCHLEPDGSAASLGRLHRPCCAGRPSVAQRRRACDSNSSRRAHKSSRLARTFLLRV